MDIRTRILKGKLIEKIQRNPEYSRALGLQDRTRFRRCPDPAKPAQADELPEIPAAPDETESTRPSYK